VAASIAAHPPKFNFVGRFLEQYAACPAARGAMSVHVVFSDEQDLELFRRGLRRFHPTVGEGLFTAVLANVSRGLLQALGMNADGDHKQILAAWKKWYGMAHLLDLGPEAPVYGLMLDAELLLYNAADCGEGSAWRRLFERLARLEASRSFPAAQVSTTLATYPLGGGNFENGCTYDRGIIKRNADWVTPGGLECLYTCQETGCRRVRQQIERCLWSWWTDLPYVNLRVAARLLSYTASREWQRRFAKIYGFKGGPREGGGCELRGPGRWRELARRVRFPMFEYVCYQQWLVLHEGFDFRDVTNVTGLAKWASFLEDPTPKSRVSELRPLWASAEAVVSSEKGRILALRRDEPPLLVFHVDHEGRRFQTERFISQWRPLVEQAERERKRAGR